MIGSAGWGLDQRASSARLGTSSAEGSVPSRPQIPDSPAGLLESGRGYRGYCSTPSFGQMKLPALLALNTGDRAIGDSLDSVSIQGYPN
jgi:hypothetical protein